MYGRTDGHFSPSNIIRSTFGSRPKKTKVMCISRKGNNKLKIYVGSLISDDGYCRKEIWSRIEMVRKVFMEKKKLFTGKMNLELKKKIMKCLVWSVALYAAEMWTLTQTERGSEAFEM